MMKILVCFLCLASPGFADEGDHGSKADFRPSRAVEKSEPSVTKYVPGRWMGGVFQYKDANGNWIKPESFKIATDKDPLVFLNKAGEKVPYEVGDVLFKSKDFGWFKSSKDSPKVEDEMVPNPDGVVLTELEYGMVKATNEWRKQRGLPALAVDPILMKTARARKSIYSHTALGMNSWTHAAKNGFRGPVTDNLTQGDRTPHGSVANLASDGPSEGHYKQLTGQVKVNGRWVDKKMNRIGVGTNGNTWVHIYGRKD